MTVLPRKSLLSLSFEDLLNVLDIEDDLGYSFADDDGIESTLTCPNCDEDHLTERNDIIYGVYACYSMT